MDGDSSPGYTTDSLGNLVPLGAGAPFIGNDGSAFNQDGTVTVPSTTFPIIAAAGVIAAAVFLGPTAALIAAGAAGAIFFASSLFWIVIALLAVLISLEILR